MDEQKRKQEELLEENLNTANLQYDNSGSLRVAE